MSNPFVIFDRDGTLIKHIHYLSDPDRVELSTNLILGLELLKERGFKFGIISNQSIINRGLATIAQVDSVNSKVIELLKRAGLKIEFTYYCPHVPEESCSCRKPEPELGLVAIDNYQIDKSRSFIVVKAIQVGKTLKKIKAADFVTDDILSAAHRIISNLDK